MMKVPPEIVFRGVESTQAIDDLITKEIAKLEQVCNYITSIRIAVERTQARHKTGNSYRLRIFVRIPDRREVKVERSSTAPRLPNARLVQQETQVEMEKEEDLKDVKLPKRSLGPRSGLRQPELPELIRGTFESARREIQSVMQKQAGDAKIPAQERSLAIVEKLFPDEGYGFLRTTEGEQLYFHKNSVLHNHWEHLAPGVAARYTAEMGKKGLQASTVELVNKPGAREMHGELHDLPRVAA
jgi:cold shock CspA family protein